MTRKITSRRSQASISIAALAAAALVAATALASAATDAHIAKASPKCNKVISVSQASTVLGVAVKKPTPLKTGNVVGGRTDSSECEFDPVTPTSAYPSGEQVVQLTVQPGANASQFHKLVSEESTSGSSPVTGGTVSAVSGMGSNAEQIVLGSTGIPTTVVFVLKGHELFFVYTFEVPTATAVAFATHVYTKI
jgi:hypothetical protein